ncbi:MAG: indole-3-glycerol phosphate synthase TrpC [Chlamydiae bacterium]|nr:indole-3-glycerol phosphate synthase TrpC [Chlamydiota bacterium]MBI3266004.1 indole-3-glycerol phosphate synthase TrpC [Chlamydiota bacterium]
MSVSFLEEIIHHKRIEIEERKRNLSLENLMTDANLKVKRADFEKAITRQPGGPLRLIAEIKKASPSKGLLRKDFHPTQIAQTYEKYGAHAISVLTDEKYFQGSLDDLKAVSEVVSLPLLRKDFILDAYQIYEAKAYGTSAILLIVAALEKNELSLLLKEAGKMGLSVLTEVHDEKELEIALEVGANLIGINNRNLKTFEVDLKNCGKLIPKIPKGKRIVIESGILKRQDVLWVESLPVDAILVGEAFMQAQDMGAKIRELMH